MEYWSTYHNTGRGGGGPGLEIRVSDSPRLPLYPLALRRSAVVEHLLEDEAGGHDGAACEEGGGELAARHALLRVGGGQQLLDAHVAHHARRHAEHAPEGGLGRVLVSDDRGEQRAEGFGEAGGRAEADRLEAGARAVVQGHGHREALGHVVYGDGDGEGQARGDGVV